MKDPILKVSFQIHCAEEKSHFPQLLTPLSCPMLTCTDVFLPGFGLPADVCSEFTHRSEQMSQNVQLRQNEAHCCMYRQEPNGGPPDYRGGIEL